MLTNQVIPKESIDKIECKFVSYIPRPDKQSNDVHLVKEKVYLKDGTTTERLVGYGDMKFPYWLTKSQYRHYEQKKEREPFDRVDKHMATLYNRNTEIARQLDMGYLLRNRDNGEFNLRKVLESPFVYGTDLPTEALLKYKYEKKWPDTFSPYTFAVYDIETDVLHGTNEIIIATLSFKEHVVTVVNEQYVKDTPENKERLKHLFTYYLGEYEKKRNITWELSFAPTPGQCVQKLFKRCHELHPDFVGSWNIDFDMPHSVEALVKEGISPADVFSDPMIPPKYRFYNYKKGRTFTTTKKGVVKLFKPAEQWHRIECPCSWQFIDPSQIYYRIRKASKSEPSYALDYILDKNLGIRKLKFKEADHLKSGSLDWHSFLQRNYPLEYIVYNTFDCISVEELDEHNLDIQITLPRALNYSPLADYDSEPVRAWTNISFKLLEKGYAPGTHDGIANELDKYSISREGWICTLNAFLFKGQRHYSYIKDAPNIITNIHLHTVDLDVKSGYPTNEIVSNMSKETYIKELVDIRDVDEHKRRMAGINLSGGSTNAVEVMVDLFGVPDLYTLGKQALDDIRDGEF